MELKSRTSVGTYYATMDDMREVCGKCKRAYYGDYSYMDCVYCPIPTVVNLTQEYASRLDKINGR